MKPRHGHSSYYKRKGLIEAGFQVQRFSPLSWPEHGGVQTDIVMEKELKVLHWNGRQQEEVTGIGLSF